MRVAYLINDYPSVSHSFIRREIQALERNGCEVMRIALRGWENNLPSKEDQDERQKTRYVLKGGAFPLFAAFLSVFVTRPVRLLSTAMLVLKMGRRAERPLPVHFIYLLEACVIVKWLNSGLIKHLHAHFGTNPAEVAMLVEKLGGPRYSFTAHGPEEFDKAAFIGLPAKIRNAAFVVAVSSFGRSQLFRQVEHRHWAKIHVVHCGLEPAFYNSVSIPPASTIRLVCVGRLCEQKGQLLLIDSARQLAERRTKFELVLAGDGELRSDIENLILRHGLSAQVCITGWISSDQVREEILKARALVLPSFAEGLPVVVMEAMALKRPIISTLVAGIPELVVPDKHGWLVPAGDVEALTDAMQNCLDADPQLIFEMGQAAQQRVVQNHDVDMEARSLAQLFRTSIDGNTPDKLSKNR